MFITTEKIIFALQKQFINYQALYVLICDKQPVLILI